MNYNELLIEADSNNLVTKEKPLKAYNGRIRDRKILIRKDMLEIQKGCVLAEELGHYHTTVGDILDQNNTENRKQERRARIWAYNKLVGLSGIVSAYRAGCRNTHEMAEHLEVTEDFLLEALDCYRQKYGTHTCFDNYTVYFEPTIGVFEVI